MLLNVYVREFSSSYEKEQKVEATENISLFFQV